MNVGRVKWNAQEIAEVLFLFVNAAQNLEEFIIIDKDEELYSSEFLS